MLISFISFLRTSSQSSFNIVKDQSKCSPENNNSKLLQIDNKEELNKSYTTQSLNVAKPDNTMIDDEVKVIMEKIDRLIEKRFEVNDDTALTARMKEIQVSFIIFLNKF